MKQDIILAMENALKTELDKQKDITDRKELIENANVLYNLNKILVNYDELEPVLTKYFADKYRKEKFKEER